ncbi:phosphopantetheine-binding protein [Fodinicola feengrottensis]|uniref:Phosphopantetheine-binding protein n=1 Tax=Fodinicola feengrottensis TaxID=435914 RepID=A0ABN2IRM5_9ACTN|nr:phosphopantetheine-binding protein [Fodinicola feengrottensis]
MTAVGGITTAEILVEISGMLRGILDDYGLDGVEITMRTTFHEELELESIDLVTVAGRIQERYGERVNLAEFLAEKDLDDVIGLRVGELVDYVADCVGAGEGEC